MHSNYKITQIDPPLIIGMRGRKLTTTGIQNAMQKLKKLMIEQEMNVFWSLHKLKSKGISDAENDRIAGHKSEQMREQYKTKVEQIKPAR